MIFGDAALFLRRIFSISQQQTAAILLLSLLTGESASRHDA